MAVTCWHSTRKHGESATSTCLSESTHDLLGSSISGYCVKIGCARTTHHSVTGLMLLQLDPTKTMLTMAAFVCGMPLAYAFLAHTCFGPASVHKVHSFEASIRSNACSAAAVLRQMSACCRPPWCAPTCISNSGISIETKALRLHIPDVTYTAYHASCASDAESAQTPDAELHQHGLQHISTGVALPKACSPNLWQCISPKSAV